MNKTKIEWCDMTWNPVWGCKNNCEYCYARKIAKRFYNDIAIKELKYISEIKEWENYHQLYIDSISKKIFNFDPVWLESNFQSSFPRKPSRIFVNSMSDIAFWTDDWMDKVTNKIEQYPDLIFIFLTKDIDVYRNYYFPKNCWLGYTFNNQEVYYNYFYQGYRPERNKYFICFEPLQSRIILFDKPDWIIIGAETGNRKNKIIPEKKWIEELVDINIPLFMKNNLRSYWNGKFRQEFPE